MVLNRLFNPLWLNADILLRGGAAVLQYGNYVVRVEFPRMDIDDPISMFECWVEALDKSIAGN